MHDIIIYLIYGSLLFVFKDNLKACAMKQIRTDSTVTNKVNEVYQVNIEVNIVLLLNNIAFNLMCEQEQLEKKKAEHGERMKNKVALVHKEAEEKRAMIEANRCEEVLKTEEMAAKYRATGTTPKKTIGCF